MLLEENSVFLLVSGLEHTFRTLSREKGLVSGYLQVENYLDF